MLKKLVVFLTLMVATVGSVTPVVANATPIVKVQAAGGLSTVAKRLASKTASMGYAGTSYKRIR